MGCLYTEECVNTMHLNKYFIFGGWNGNFVLSKIITKKKKTKIFRWIFINEKDDA